jgi:PadR family transcriptional regulator PadR
MSAPNDRKTPLGDLEKFILLAILKVRNNAYGTEIKNEIKEVINKDISVGALYTTLDRLENRGFVKSRMGEATEERGGRAKKYFRVTAEGQTALERSLDEIARMANLQPIGGYV